MCVCVDVSQTLDFLVGGSLRVILGMAPVGVKGSLVITFFPIVSIYTEIDKRTAREVSRFKHVTR